MITLLRRNWNLLTLVVLIDPFRGAFQVESTHKNTIIGPATMDLALIAAANAQTSLHIRAASPEPSLLADTKYGRRGRSYFV